MLRRLSSKIVGAVDFLVDLINWLDDRTTSREFERTMLRPEPSRANSRVRRP